MRTGGAAALLLGGPGGRGAGGGHGAGGGRGSRGRLVTASGGGAPGPRVRPGEETAPQALGAANGEPSPLPGVVESGSWGQGRGGGAGTTLLADWPHPAPDAGAGVRVARPRPPRPRCERGGGPGPPAGWSVRGPSRGSAQPTNPEAGGWPA